MSEKDKVPDKINLDDLLGESDGGEPGEIEILDPDSGRPVEGEAAAEDAHDGDEPGSEPTIRGGQGEDYHDLYMRTRADFENFRKRIERERSEERRQAASGLVKEILPVLDNLERALEGAPPEDAFAHGVELISRQLQEVLTQAGLSPIEAQGKAFDPIYHEAVATEPSGEVEPNHVLAEIQKGYMFRDRVLRPSLVRVSAAPAGSTRSGEAQEDET